MKGKILSHTISVFKPKEADQITAYSQRHNDLFDYCYSKGLSGTVTKKRFTQSEYHLISITLTEIVKLQNGEFIEI